MNDVSMTYLVTQEALKEMQRRKLEREDPDNFERYAMWDDIGARTTLMDRFRSLAAWLRRGNHTVTKTECPPAASAKGVPQT